MFGGTPDAFQLACEYGPSHVRGNGKIPTPEALKSFTLDWTSAESETQVCFHTLTASSWCWGCSRHFWCRMSHALACAAVVRCCSSGSSCSPYLHRQLRNTTDNSGSSATKQCAFQSCVILCNSGVVLTLKSHLSCIITGSALSALSRPLRHQHTAMRWGE